MNDKEKEYQRQYRLKNKEKLELIAQARELCEKRVAQYPVTLEAYQEKSGAGYEWAFIKHNAWATHLAEMDEHRAQDPFDNGRETCGECTTLAPSVIKYPCNFIVTKAKRLLGVGND